MAQEAKTKSAAFDKATFLDGIDRDRRAEVEQLLAIFTEVTGWEPRL